MKCETCRWFRLIAPGKSPHAECRRYPPMWAEMGVCQYPMVMADDGCGEWTPKTMRQINEASSEDTSAT